MPSRGFGALGSAAAGSLIISKSKPPVSGVASISFTVTGMPSGQRAPVRSPTRAWLLSSWTKYSPPSLDTGHRPSAPVSFNFTNRPKRVTPVIRPSNAAPTRSARNEAT